MKFIIDCKTWRSGLNGEYKIGIGKTRLLNEQGCMCIMGQCLSQAGLPKQELLNKGTPKEVINLHTKKYLKNTKLKPFHLGLDNWFYSTRLTLDAMLINDNPNKSFLKKKEELIALFEENNLELEFINEPESLIIENIKN